MLSHSQNVKMDLMEAELAQNMTLCHNGKDTVLFYNGDESTDELEIK